MHSSWSANKSSTPAEVPLHFNVSQERADGDLHGDHFRCPQSQSGKEDQQLLAIGGYQTAVVWDIAAGRVAQTFVGYKDTVSAVKFSPDQKMIATTSWDYTVRLWDATTGKQLAVLKGHKAGVLNCIFSPDGRTLVTGSDDRSIIESRIIQ